jgi:hypothetical protein
MKKKILVTSALVSSLVFLGSNATAQTKITGDLTLAYKQVDFDLASSKVNNVRGLGREAQLNVSNSGNLNIGGIKYAAGFAFEFDGGKERTTNGDLSISNENTYVDLILGDTTLTFGVDHIQNSDRTTANFVGMNVEDMDNGNTFFLSSIGANPKESIGAGVVQKTPYGSFSFLYVPGNGVSGQDDDLDNFTEAASPLGSGITLTDRASAYEAGFQGNLGITGLQAHFFRNKEKANTGSLNENKSLEGTTVGVSYNFGIITAGIDKKKNKGRFASVTSEAISETSQTGYGLAYAITPTLTLGANYTKANTTGPTTSVVDEKYKSIALGYNLGPVVAEVQYGQFQNAKGVGSADFTSTYARLITKF